MIRAAPDVGLIAVSQLTPYDHLNHFYERLQARPGPLWVKSGHMQRTSSCPLSANSVPPPASAIASAALTFLICIIARSALT